MTGVETREVAQRGMCQSMKTNLKQPHSERLATALTNPRAREPFPGREEIAEQASTNQPSVPAASANERASRARWTSLSNDRPARENQTNSAHKSGDHRAQTYQSWSPLARRVCDPIIEPRPTPFQRGEREMSIKMLPFYGSLGGVSKVIHGWI